MSVQHLDVEVDLDGVLRALRDYAERTARDVHRRGPSALQEQVCDDWTPPHPTPFGGLDAIFKFWGVESQRGALHSPWASGPRPLPAALIRAHPRNPGRPSFKPESAPTRLTTLHHPLTQPGARAILDVPLEQHLEALDAWYAHVTGRLQNFKARTSNDDAIFVTTL